MQQRRSLAALSVSVCLLHLFQAPAAAAAPHVRKYVSLGDSYTSMSGVSPIAPTLEDRACSRSERSYPSVVAEGLGLKRGGSFVDASCGGADTGAALSPYVPNNPGSPKGVQVPSQIDSVSEDTDLVTLSLGGNDDQFFNELLGTCQKLGAEQPDGNPCEQNGGAQSQVLSPEGLEAAFADIARGDAAAVRAIRQKAPNARVFVVGYPKVFPDAESCADSGTLASGDLPWINSLLGRLNGALASAAAAGGGKFLDIYPMSAGHEICGAASPWIAGRNLPPGARVGYHPLPAEGQAVGAFILENL